MYFYLICCLYCILWYFLKNSLNFILNIELYKKNHKLKFLKILKELISYMHENVCFSYANKTYYSNQSRQNSLIHHFTGCLIFFQCFIDSLNFVLKTPLLKYMSEYSFYVLEVPEEFLNIFIDIRKMSCVQWLFVMQCAWVWEV